MTNVSPKFAIWPGDVGCAGDGVGPAGDGTVVPMLATDEGVSVGAATNPGVGLPSAVGVASLPQARARKAVRPRRTAVTDNRTIPNLMDTTTHPSQLMT